MVKNPSSSGSIIKRCDVSDASLIHRLGLKSPMMAPSGGRLRGAYYGSGFSTMVLDTRRLFGSNVRCRSPRELASW